MVGVIDRVSCVCFGIGVERREGLHRNLVIELKKLFVGGGYRVNLEYPICFESKVRKSGEKVLREGYVDLFAVKNGRKIAIEFDTGVHLKFKSIEKLFQVDADLCIGIVRGNANALEDNIARIEAVKKECGLSKKNLWLVVLCDRIARNVCSMVR